MSTSVPEIVKSSENPGPIELTIIDKLVSSLKPSYLKIANDSHKHAHHAGLRGASNVTESHFRIEVVSSEFEGKNMPSRHRVVYQLLDDEFKNKGLHALQMKTKTQAEVAK
ncbi:bola-like protein [Suhomyces tanzawaensis NRRL Y-17324]|uniref:Bola-like protein n=1 Tax=Suhomyces tanzawaensis NRRL Y-17324 TaxID=984487 RepID=A0A1E4SE71_9ASCO|nr:bola-like protein [Suhomyces tanzawaensis NRRL Y-17324]ODV77821.1 bola-like protein [Suhomyces tanzawaensis NRRL Y-17324]